jgi:hypothetical protein
VLIGGVIIVDRSPAALSVATPPSAVQTAPAGYGAVQPPEREIETKAVGGIRSNGEGAQPDTTTVPALKGGVEHAAGQQAPADQGPTGKAEDGPVVDQAATPQAPAVDQGAMGKAEGADPSATRRAEVFDRTATGNAEVVDPSAMTKARSVDRSATTKAPVADHSATTRAPVAEQSATQRALVVDQGATRKAEVIDRTATTKASGVEPTRNDKDAPPVNQTATRKPAVNQSATKQAPVDDAKKQTVQKVPADSLARCRAATAKKDCAGVRACAKQLETEDPTFYKANAATLRSCL